MQSYRVARRRFWALCSDAVWDAGYQPKPADLETEEQDLLFRRTAGFRLPEPFDESELRDAWVRAGRQPGELAALGERVRAELRHPFTLRAFLELETNVETFRFWRNADLGTRPMD